MIIYSYWLTIFLNIYKIKENLKRGGGRRSPELQNGVTGDEW